MAESFSVAEVPDPNQITDFIEATTGSIATIFDVIIMKAYHHNLLCNSLVSEFEFNIICQ